MIAVRRVLRALATIALIAHAYPVAAAEPADLEALRFLTGAWGSEDGIVEYWLPPLRGLMVGLNRDPGGDGVPFFENLRIEARSGGIYYVASPRGEGTTDFKLTEHSVARAVFENPEHDFPQKIIYVRTGDRLEAEVGGMRDGAWSSFTLNWSAVACTPGD